MCLTFDWDPRKAAINVVKHRPTFEKATEVFSDPLAKIFADEWHPEGERREIIIGHLHDRKLIIGGVDRTRRGLYPNDQRARSDSERATRL